MTIQLRNPSRDPYRVKGPRDDDDKGDPFNRKGAFEVSITEGRVLAPSEEKDENGNLKVVEIPTKLLNIFIFDVITSPEQFIPAILALQTLSDTDHVCVHVSTPGGDVDATDTFLTALSMCPAPNTFIATGGCHSAGTILLLHADEVQFSEGFNSLIHIGSMGYGGKSSDFRTASKFLLDFDETLMYRTYKFFLTDEEIARCIKGEDFWFTADEFQARLLKRNKLEEDEE